MKIFAIILAIALTPACGDSDADNDAGMVIVDARRNLDSGVALCGDAAHCAGEPFAGLCIDGRCAECGSAADCDVAGGALGPSCDTAAGYCTCAGAADCAGSPHGPVCIVQTGTCGCVTVRDCPDGELCSIEPYLGSGVRTCQTR